MQSNQSETPSQVTDIERAYFEARRIRKELDGLVQFLAMRIPEKETRCGPVEAIDPRTKKPFRR